MTIRLLQPNEAHLMVEGGHRFFAEGKLPGKFNPDNFVTCWTGYIQSGIGDAIAMFTEEGKIAGALGAIFYNDPLTGDKVGTEMFFFVYPEYRGKGMKLFDFYLARAEERQCERVMMIHLESLHPEALKRIYERKGFRLVETAYMKELAQ